MKKLLAVVLSLVLMVTPVLSLAVSSTEELLAGKLVAGKTTFSIRGMEEMLSDFALQFFAQLNKEAGKIDAGAGLCIGENEVLSAQAELTDKEIVVTSNAIGNKPIAATYDELLTLLKSLVEYVKENGQLPADFSLEAMMNPDNQQAGFSFDPSTMNMDALMGILEVAQNKIVMEPCSEEFVAADFFGDETLTAVALPTQTAEARIALTVDSELVNAVCDGLLQLVKDNEEAFAEVWKDEYTEKVEEIKAEYAKKTAPWIVEAFCTMQGIPVAVVVKCEDEDVNVLVKAVLYVDGSDMHLYLRSWEKGKLVMTGKILFVGGAMSVEVDLFTSDERTIRITFDMDAPEITETSTKLHYTTACSDGTNNFTFDKVQDDELVNGELRGTRVTTIYDGEGEDPLMKITTNLVSSEAQEDAMDREGIVYPLSMKDEEVKALAEELQGNLFEFAFSLLQYLPEDALEAVGGLLMQ